MAVELSYVLFTPHTLIKARTGGILARLLSQLDLELVGAQVFIPDGETVEAYANSMIEHTNPEKPVTGEILADYIRRTMTPSDRGHRVALFLFKGEEACSKLKALAGSLFPYDRSGTAITGESIRDTYADLIYEDEQSHRPIYIEPALFTPPNQKEADHNLGIFLHDIKGKSNLVDKYRPKQSDKAERTLVIIKPDNWSFASSRPGTILDMFSRTGLRIVGCKMYRMSVNEGLEFYGQVEGTLKDKLGPIVGQKADVFLEKEFHMTLPHDVADHIKESFGDAYAHDQFVQIVEFMTGIRYDEFPRENWDKPGSVKCMLVVYEGVNAVEKIRKVLGPTDPSKAPGGTIRREFGSDVMVNTAHASDSVKSAEREFEVVKIDRNDCSRIIERWLDGHRS